MCVILCTSSPCYGMVSPSAAALQISPSPAALPPCSNHKAQTCYAHSILHVSMTSHSRNTCTHTHTHGLIMLIQQPTRRWHVLFMSQFFGDGSPAASMRRLVAPLSRARSHAAGGLPEGSSTNAAAQQQQQQGGARFHSTNTVLEHIQAGKEHNVKLNPYQAVCAKMRF